MKNEVNMIPITALFPDHKILPKATHSSYVYTIGYGSNGNNLEISLFHSEDEGDDEWHLNVSVCDANGDIHSRNSFNATMLND